MKRLHRAKVILEAPPGFEPGMEVLQTSALPLGDGADRMRVLGTERTPHRTRRPQAKQGSAPRAVVHTPRLWYANHFCPASGNNSVVECDLAKVEVAGSNPVSRSILKSSGTPAPRLAPFAPLALTRLAPLRSHPRDRRGLLLEGYSARNAVNGSTRVARQAGTRLATNATAARPAAAPRKLTASVARTS